MESLCRGSRFVTHFVSKTLTKCSTSGITLFGGLTSNAIKTIRTETAGRKTPWTAEELKVRLEKR
jgi:hypothetical protein